ncbi:hypothetical protein [Acidianus sp. HS-5]|uniref:hypothetical protein n=1 Tax=Acidianus sp. HS-5 TaxID=2886040 RepID=UPI001F1EA1E4|nr:hypothetical protein [Acidianus sp. HS-5]BDC18494.1 hypothetical protein HS5_13840 [Acidianus sp. HS-5]
MVNYLALLSSQNPYDRLDGWFKIDWLIQNDIVSKEKLIEMKDKFLELLSYNDDTVKLHAWEMVPKLISKGIITVEDVKKYDFLSLLYDSEAWLLVRDLVNSGVVDVEKVKKEKEKYISFLKGNELDRIASWSLILDMFNAGIITKEEIEDNKKYLLELFNFPAYDIRFNLLFLVSELLKKGVISQEELKPYDKKIEEIIKDKDFKQFVKIYEKDPRELESLGIHIFNS